MHVDACLCAVLVCSVRTLRCGDCRALCHLPSSRMPLSLELFRPSSWLSSSLSGRWLPVSSAPEALLRVGVAPPTLLGLLSHGVWHLLRGFLLAVPVRQAWAQGRWGCGV